jgi:ABC-type lipoprotein export system ATPase subunit
MASLLRMANIEKSYFITKTQKQDVLKGINAEFDRGELVALLGESGCGKSTLINILGGLDSEYTGSVVVKGQFLRDYSQKEMDDYRKKRVGLIFQNYNLINHMTIIENIEISMQMSDIDEKVRKERAMDLLKLVGLSDHAKKLPTQLSGGQKQRVAIARSLANNPSIILADEPTGALDKESEDIIMKILKKIVESGKLVIIVTHSQIVANQCSRVVYIDEGKICVFYTSPSPRDLSTSRVPA